MTRKYIITADDSIKGFDEEIAKLEREWGAEEIEPCEDCISRKQALDDKGLAEFHRYDDYVKMRNYLKSLPSVTPRTNLAETSQDCISREEIRKVLSNEVFALMKLHTVNPEDNPKADAMAHGVNWSLNTLMELPSVTPQRPKGRWIDIRAIKAFHYDGEPRVRCSCCGNEEEWSSNYCPNCGAEMEDAE